MGYENLSGEIRQSEWNSASYKMRRLDEIMSKLNMLNQSPLSYDEVTGEEAYLLIFRCCDSLYHEVQASLNDDERKRAEEFRRELEDYIIKNPIRIHLKKNGVTTGNIILKKEIWERIRKGLWIYEKMVRDFVLKVGMDTAENQDYEGY